jgi:hypothetical protein
MPPREPFRRAVQVSGALRQGRLHAWPSVGSSSFDVRAARPRAVSMVSQRRLFRPSGRSGYDMA